MICQHTCIDEIDRFFINGILKQIGFKSYKAPYDKLNIDRSKQE